MTEMLKVTSLVDEFRRRGSDRLMNLPSRDATDDLYLVCDVLPQEPTREQFDDLAVRMSNFLEDAHRRHVDGRASSADQIGVLSVPMSLPIVHRARLAQVKQEAIDKRLPGLQMTNWPAERETICMLYLNVPRWRGHEQGRQLAALDEVARRYRLRCVDQGVIPQPGD